MAEAVAAAMEDKRHLLVQAGTGTGKSLGYLVPALLHRDRVVVATATLALQHQLVERDIPALLEAAGDQLEGGGTFAVLKGRSNYACLHRVREGVPDDQGALVELPEGRWAPRWWPCGSGSRRRPRTTAPASATTRRGTPTGSGGRSASATASASAPASAPTAPSASPSGPRSAPTAPS